MITIKPIHTTFATKAPEIDPEKFQEIIKTMGELLQKRAESEITRALVSPLASVLKPSIKFDEDKSLLDRNNSVLWDTRLSYGFGTQYQSHSPYIIGVDYALGSGGSITSTPPNQHTTTRKDGREQLTCTCGVVPFPHRYKSVPGCGE